LAAHQQTQGTTATGNQVQNMDTDNLAPEVPPEPDFSFTRPTYLPPSPPSPSRKQFFQCAWRINIPKNTLPKEGLRDAILEIWSVLKDADRCLIIYP
jgi:hypothetical protein